MTCQHGYWMITIIGHPGHSGIIEDLRFCFIVAIIILYDLQGVLAAIVTEN